MKYSINLFGYNLDCQLKIDGESLHIEIPEDNQKALKQYLIRVLPKYGRESSSAFSLQELVKLAIDAEKTLEGHMAEPKLKLPYEFQPEIKEKLVEAAALQDMSATQLLIRLIEKKYQEVMG
ncbi:hypothetical protein [Paenibacillus macerans]|uniref:Uncharacterized protein n=1 Tax=Paenibacillus macerans TaxID=44252 RepID=A0A090ZM37_PAEMA|nr:hypothetical protein [Paenibacillus macerans]KFN11473.1 hypothetical protein DJ90_3790 [Paenibacillus macerans]MBS5913974.1 hypothetical protein [Paenibacillus macerans]MCY7562059.1 hypothetical protein [Paenibacillus macerans]MEC0153558.1 hypothetical protein [Paenibacillus macerans]SUA86175.1 Uncharacterised protein [Paenibacillus macerans]